MTTNFGYAFILMKKSHIIFLIFFFCTLKHLYSQNNNLQQIQNERSVRESGIAYLKLAKQFIDSNLDSTLYFLDNVDRISVQYGMDSLLLESKIERSVAYFYDSNIKKSKAILFEAEFLAKKLDKSIKLAIIYRNLGAIYAEIGDNDSAISFFEKALKYSDEKEKLGVLNNIGILHGINGDLDLYETNLLMVLEMGKDFLNKKDIGELDKQYIIDTLILCLNNLSAIVNDYNIGLNYSDEALFYINNKYDIGNKNSYLSMVFSTRGRLHYKFGFIKEAEKLYKKSIRFGDNKNNQKLTLQNYIYLVELYNSQKNYVTANKYLDSVLSTSRDSFVKGFPIDSLAFSTKLKAKQYKEAAYFAESYIQNLDSTLKEKKKFAYEEFTKKYQTKKKIQENELLKKENQIKDLEVDKQKTVRNYLILFSVLGVVALGATYSRFRVKKKAANVLAQQNTVINQQKTGLEKSNANKQRLFGIIAHDLVNPFNAILGYTQLLEEDYDSFDEAQRKHFIATINKYAFSNYNLTRTLLDWANVQQDHLVVNKTQISCKAIVTTAIQPYQVLADKKEIEVVNNVPEHIILEADQNMMQMVVGNLFVNAIKFTPQGGNITFNLNKNNDGTITLEIIDNGIGMSQEQLNNLFDIAKATTLKGTNNEKGNGLGLILCKELMELQNGTLQMFSQFNKGSKAVVTI